MKMIKHYVDSIADVDTSEVSSQNISYTVSSVDIDSDYTTTNPFSSNIEDSSVHSGGL